MTRRKKTAAPEEVTEQQSMELLAQITRMINAWEKHAPDAKFAGMTVDEFRKATQPSFDAHAEVSRLEWELERLKKSLDDEALDDSPPQH
jgi:hypothetical protein